MFDRKTVMIYARAPPCLTTLELYLLCPVDAVLISTALSLSLSLSLCLCVCVCVCARARACSRAYANYLRLLCLSVADGRHYRVVHIYLCTCMRLLTYHALTQETGVSILPSPGSSAGISLSPSPPPLFSIFICTCPSLLTRVLSPWTCSPVRNAKPERGTVSLCRRHNTS